MDANAHAINKYLSQFDNPLGQDVGEECNAFQEPDEDCPVSWKCTGTMVTDEEEMVCDTCGRSAEATQ